MQKWGRLLPAAAASGGAASGARDVGAVYARVGATCVRFGSGAQLVCVRPDQELEA